MKLRPGRLPVFLAHIVAAVMDRKADIGESGSNVSRRNPVCRILGVVVVTIHRETVRTEKVIAISIAVFILCTDIIVANRCPQAVLIRDFDLIGIGAVAGITDDVGAIQGKH